MIPTSYKTKKNTAPPQNSRSRAALFVWASGAHRGERVAGVRVSAGNPNRRPLLPAWLPWDLLGRPRLESGEEGVRTRNRPPRPSGLLVARDPGTAAPARWPSKDPPGPKAGGATRPDWCSRSADHCGNPGGGERGRMRSPGLGREPEGRAEEALRP